LIFSLLGAKFTNDSNCFVCEVGRGSGALCWNIPSLEIAEVLRGGKEMMNIFWEKVRENLYRLSFNEFKLATNKALGYEFVNCDLKF